MLFHKYIIYEPQNSSVWFRRQFVLLLGFWTYAAQKTSSNDLYRWSLYFCLRWSLHIWSHTFVSIPILTIPDQSWSFHTIPNQSWSLLTSLDPFCKVLIIPDQSWSFLTTWPFLINTHQSWPFLTSPDHVWPVLIIPDQSWSFLTSYDHSWLVPIIPD